LGGLKRKADRSPPFQAIYEGFCMAHSRIAFWSAARESLTFTHIFLSSEMGLEKLAGQRPAI